MSDHGNTSATEYLKTESERHRKRGETREADACLLARRKLLSRGDDDG